MRSLSAAVSVALIAALAPAPARADAFFCKECGPLAEDYSVDLRSCRRAAPAVSGKAAARLPESVGTGHFVEVDLAGDGAHKAWLWIALSDDSIPYVAAFVGQAKKSSWCQALGDFEEVRREGGNYRSLSSFSGVPLVDISSFARNSACASYGGYAEVAWLSISRRWAVLHTVSDIASRCREDGEPDPELAVRSRRMKAHAQGLEALRRGDLAQAEKLFRSALPDPEAASSLGQLLSQQGKDAEAEPYLLLAAYWNLHAEVWLDLADLYWKTGNRGQAAVAYRAYLKVLRSPDRLRPGEKPREPERRALKRAAKPEIPKPASPESAPEQP